MNPYFIIGVIASSMLIYALLVVAVTLTGLSIGISMIVVYAIMLCCMYSMQKRARQAYTPQMERRRSPAIAASTIAAPSLGVPLTAPVSLNRLVEQDELLEQEAANQDLRVTTSAVGALDAR